MAVTNAAARAHQSHAWHQSIVGGLPNALTKSCVYSSNKVVTLSSQLEIDLENMMYVLLFDSHQLYVSLCTPVWQSWVVCFLVYSYLIVMGCMFPVCAPVWQSWVVCFLVCSCLTVIGCMFPVCAPIWQSWVVCFLVCSCLTVIGCIFPVCAPVWQSWVVCFLVCSCLIVIGCMFPVCAPVWWSLKFTYLKHNNKCPLHLTIEQQCCIIWTETVFDTSIVNINDNIYICSTTQTDIGKHYWLCDPK